MSESKMPAKTYEHMDKAIRQLVRESGICPQCDGSGSATFFSDFPCSPQSLPSAR